MSELAEIIRQAIDDVATEIIKSNEFRCIAL